MEAALQDGAGLVPSSRHPVEAGTRHRTALTQRAKSPALAQRWPVLLQRQLSPGRALGRQPRPGRCRALRAGAQACVGPGCAAGSAHLQPLALALAFSDHEVRVFLLPPAPCPLQMLGGQAGGARGGGSVGSLVVVPVSPAALQAAAVDACGELSRAPHQLCALLALLLDLVPLSLV